MKKNGKDNRLERLEREIERIEAENKELKGTVDLEVGKLNSTFMEGTMLEEKFKKLENNFFVIKEGESRIEEFSREIRNLKSHNTTNLESIKDTVKELDLNLATERKKVYLGKKVVIGKRA